MNQALKSLLTPIGASAFAMVVGGIIVLCIGYNPLVVYGALFSGAFGGAINFADTLAVAIPLILSGLGIAIAFKSGLFNIGAEGQYWVGAMAAAYVGDHFRHLSGPLHIVLILLAAMAAGGLWGGVIPGLTKAFVGAHEVITTMMLSYIGILLARYMIEDGPMRAPGYTPESPEVARNTEFHVLIPDSQLTTWALILAILAVIVVWWMVYKTTLGYRLRTVGLNHRAARYAGIKVPLYIIFALGLSGLFAGLAGGVQMLAIDHQLMDSFTTQYGYTAIVVALLARNNPFGVVLAAVFFSALGTGGNNMQQVSGVPASLTDVLTGLIVFFVASERILPMLRSWFHTRRSQDGLREGIGGRTR